MSRLLRVQWTIVPLFPPRPWRHCSGCRQQQPFECSGKFRLNANGKRLDAWLIYRCTACDGTWNRTIFERKAPSEIDPATLAELQTNDAALARRLAFDVSALRQSSQRIDESEQVEVTKLVVADEPSERHALEILFVAPFPVAVRLDRLLAEQLGVSRSRIARMAEEGRLTPSAALRKPVRDGLVVRVELEDQEVAVMALALPRRC